MGSRERKRTARRKRKERAVRRQTETDPATGEPAAAESPESGAASGGAQTPSHNGDAPVTIEALAEEGRLSRSELRNQAARERLVPLRAGERPRAVTIGAVISAILFVAAIAGWALWDVLRDDARPSLIAVLLFAAVVGTMAWGMWKVRYWAVLGFQALLLFSILGSAIGIVNALTWLAAVGNFILLVGAGTLFVFMVKAMARIQMPERRPS